MKEKKKKWILDILTDIAGGLLLSIAISQLCGAGRLSDDRCIGVALIFYQLFGLPDWRDDSGT